MTSTTPSRRDVIIAASAAATALALGAPASAAPSQALVTRVLALGRWTEQATGEARARVLPFEARATLSLQLAGKIDQWFARSDGAGFVFVMNVTDPADARAMLERLPLGQAGLMAFDLIAIGPLWPLGLLIET